MPYVVLRVTKIIELQSRTVVGWGRVEEGDWGVNV